MSICYRIQLILLGNLNLVIQNFQHMLVSDEVKTKVGPLCGAPLRAKNITNIWFNLKNNDLNELNSGFFGDPISWPLSRCFPEQINRASSLCRAFVFVVPQKSEDICTFVFYSDLFKCHPLMKDFLTILSIAVLIIPCPLPLLLFFRTLARKVIIDTFTHSTVSVSSIGMLAHQGSANL